MDGGDTTTGGAQLHPYDADDQDMDLMGQDGQAQVMKTTYICGNCGKNVKLDRDAGIRC